jgi:hypothetical protein
LSSSATAWRALPLRSQVMPLMVAVIMAIPTCAVFQTFCRQWSCRLFPFTAPRLRCVLVDVVVYALLLLLLLLTSIIIIVTTAASGWPGENRFHADHPTVELLISLCTFTTFPAIAHRILDKVPAPTSCLAYTPACFLLPACMRTTWM